MEVDNLVVRLDGEYVLLLLGTKPQAKVELKTLRRVSPVFTGRTDDECRVILQKQSNREVLYAVVDKERPRQFPAQGVYHITPQDLQGSVFVE
ncbi:hypothetical protein [Chromobacterium aquaticum]|uniref:Uncharacterized protein n=1 Tax=Chromobacterium aquaticum TaxID=467180 RepID=A0ABV8ZPF0_9NEIS|nr:hypothetical protein [Chromobacterium aquaticum]MCD5361213.1 hypothetical protein [Chromobacterium aquaticum]